MEYTEEQKAAFKQEFAIRRRRQLILAVPLIIVAIGFALIRDEKTQVLGLSAPILAPVFVVFVIGALVFSFRNWRCPACDKYLGKGSGPKFCPKCGVALQ